MSVRQHILAGAGCQLESVLATFEGLGERALCDDLEELIGRVLERKADEEERRAS